MKKSPLQKEILQRRGFDSPRVEALLNILRTQSVLMGPLSALFKEYGLSQPLYNILRILRGAAPEGLCVQEVADRMIAREPDTTRLLDRLETLGYARRERSKEDRRVVRVHITRAGLEILATLEEPLQRVHEALLGHLTDADLASISRLMAKARKPHTS
ncbi:MAG: MarR family transcriptional regulator [Candidatus Hydrogenedentes bacterium]|nr:MarR family transcriptional regulator [Candidatus Hydrogenedentota bacterium]